MSAPAQLADRRIPAGDDFLASEELRALTPAELIRRTTALKPLIAAHARECEMLRRPVDAVWSALRKTGIFYHFVPKLYGGLEFDVDSFIDAMLPIGEACASTGWVAAFCVEHNWMLSQFPKALQDETFGGEFPYIIAPGATMPPGTAKPVEGGYRLTGRWKWGTGVMHADWVLVTGMVAGETPPRVLFFAIPAGEIEVPDVWHVDGMAGTGSNDIVARDVFIPEHRVMDMGDMRAGKAYGARLYDNPIYRMPMLPFLAVTAAIPAVGAARSAVAAFRERLSVRNMHGTDQKQADKPAAQMRLAKADILTKNAEMLVRHAARANVALGACDKPAEVSERIELRLFVAEAMAQCREAISTLCEASGAGAHFLDNPIQRALRDVNVMSSHVVYDLDSAREQHGRALIGLPPNSPVV
ncbi:Flavin-dependent monooxygenase, oxygenase subunit HsaA [Alphaproteobacteria bacterium SO-S41]|nr:Flavin-dependent monooxygenase, oxygenase subunit HsaA [Alphaproteobacteria bacterium SO-S41]